LQEEMTMNVQALKPKLGRWLTIDELRGFLAELPDQTGKRIPVNRKLLETASEFVEKKRGWWEHEDWNDFLAGLGQEGFELSEDSRAPIGNILEIFKAYYHNDDFRTIAEKRRKSATVRSSRSARG